MSQLTHMSIDYNAVVGAVTTQEREESSRDIFAAGVAALTGRIADYIMRPVDIIAICIRIAPPGVVEGNHTIRSVRGGEFRCLSITFIA